ncbi:prephenate dehydrogenase [Lentibacillus amyloliquefaciens]|uniref:Prephenate dehydrogenase n=1 Tax=Lentibacillus amyloliquefaciens TaxID=1472767 RepID=A0A0U4FJM1_9BACI|nr:prephenate dehydrogenase [Lentibacillus amyloliquefaciens]ALX47956.1 prephenate dehydrogenase [Lentibacillus amyloliquefaciens]
MRRRILVIGLGLIGGSLAKSLRESEDNYITGFDINHKSLAFAEMNEIIHESCSDITEAAKNADFIFLGTHITETVEILKKLEQITFDHDVIVSDVSSVKQAIHDTANAINNQQIQFVGGHPMAGSHKKGITAAKGHLFENAIYVLSPSANCLDSAADKLEEVLTVTKSHIIQLKANEHDEMTGVVSHFPHLIASALVQQAKKWSETHAYIPKLAAGGFRDVTRIASSNPELWQDIFYHNKQKMVKMIDDWTSEMVELKEMLEENHKADLTAYLQQAKDYRDGLDVKEKGAFPAYYDLYVDIRDQTGAIATVANLLAGENINITNIRILEIREGITGALRLSVSTKDEQLQSYDILKQNGYDLVLEE